MGQDFDAFTIIGIRIPLEKITFKVCDCGEKEPEDFCKECNNKFTFGNKSYGTYQEFGEDGGDFENYVFICLEKYGKSFHDIDEVVKCPFTFEQLIEKRNEMKKNLENVLTNDEFDSYFGIYTTTEYSY